MIETILVFIILIGLVIQTMKKPKNYPPGPIPLPLIGNFLALDLYNPQISWELVHQRYGDIVGMMVPKFKLIVVSGWSAIKEALANEDLNGRPDVCLLRDRFESGGRFGLVFKDGPDWRVQRRFTLHHFRNLGFGRKTHEAVVFEEAESLVKELEGLQGTPIAMEERFAMSSINITWCLLGGKRYQRTDPQLKHLAGYVKELMHCVNVVGSPAVILPVLRYIFPYLTGYESIKHTSKGIMQFVKASIEEHSKRSEDANHKDDYISLYLQEMNQPSADKSFSIQQLEGICQDLLCAGADTSASVLSFAILFLCIKEEMQDKMFQEIQNFVGSERLPSIDDRPNFVYTDAFLTEVMRYRPVAPAFPPHRALADTKLGGYHIPENATILLNYDSITMDPHYWGDPENFRPERFITEDGKLRKEERLIPFGKGKRSCLGETVARMSTFLILIGLVQKFTFKFPKGEELKDTRGVPGFTQGPPDYRVIATRRNSYQ